MVNSNTYAGSPLGHQLGWAGPRAAPVKKKKKAAVITPAQPVPSSIFDSTSIRITYNRSGKQFQGGSRKAGEQGDVIWYDNMQDMFGTGEFSVLSVATVNAYGGGDHAWSSAAIDMANSGYNRVGFRVGTKHIICHIYDGGYKELHKSISLNKKYAFFMTVGGGLITLRVSGESTVSTGSGAISYYQDLYEIGGGNKNYPNQPFNGTIHDFAIWKRALSSSDLAKLKAEVNSAHSLGWT